MYLNLVTGDFITDDAKVKETDKGLMYYQDGCWKFLPTDEYKEVDDAVQTISGGVVSYEDIGIDELIDVSTTKTQDFRYYTAYFGLNELTVGYKKFVKTSGCISDSISVYAGIPIKLKVNLISPEYTNVEFSIIDGYKETPITPYANSIVEHEKVFFNTKPRMDSEEYTYYRNFTKIDKFTGYEEDIYDDDVLYTVSYRASYVYQEYTPTNSTVKLKTIVRIYKDGVISPQVITPILTQGVE